MAPCLTELFSLYQASVGGFIGTAVKLNRQDADIAINWVGSRASPCEEDSEFVFSRLNGSVYYIDIHHGDGVEEAFYVTDRLMTVPFHKFGDFFPVTGQIKDIEVVAGKNYALNVPLNDGVNYQNFLCLFCPVIQKVMKVYQLDVFLQCGADSLAVIG